MQKIKIPRHALTLALIIGGGLATTAHTQLGPPPTMPSMDYIVDLKRDTVDPKLLRAPSPEMPMDATRSGYCCVDFDIDASGKAVTIKPSFCSEALFKVNAVKAVSGAEFSPAQVGGVRRRSDGHSFDIVFKKEDVNGLIKPSADGRLTEQTARNGTSMCPAY